MKKQFCSAQSQARLGAVPVRSLPQVVWLLFVTATCITQPQAARAFTLIDSQSQGTITPSCSTRGNASQIIVNPNDHWWWGTPPNPPGPVVIRYRFTAAFDAAFANTSARPSLNAEIKAQVELAFNTWESANITPRAGPVNYLRTGSQPFGDIRSIALHEIGHLLGFHHPDLGTAFNANFCPGVLGFTPCFATGAEVMNSTIGQGNYNHILSYDELDAFSFTYPGQTVDFQMVAGTAPAEIDIDAYTADRLSNWALTTLCGDLRVPTSTLQGRGTTGGKIQFNTAASVPIGFRTKGINWDYECTSIATRELRIQTRGTDNPRLFARYDGPAPGNPYTFMNYANDPVAGLKDDRLHTWSNPSTPIPPEGLIHVGIEQDVWDWWVVSAVAVDARGTPCTASLVSFHEWNNQFPESAATAGGAENREGELNMPVTPAPHAFGILLRTSDSPVNGLLGLAIADVTGMKLGLKDLNRPLLERLRDQNKLEVIDQFGIRELKPHSDFILVFKGKEDDLPPNIRSNRNFLIIDRPQYVERDLFVFVESKNDEGVSGSYALLSPQVTGNVPGAQHPRLQIALLPRPNRAVKLCWPDPSTGFVLQSTPSLEPPFWSNVVAQIVVTNRLRCVTLPAEGQHKFFRLYNPDPGACFPLPDQQCLD